MARRTIGDILAQLKEQNYAPRVVVFSDGNYGRVEIAVENVTEARETYTTFVARRAGNEERNFETLAGALGWIGVPVR